MAELHIAKKHMRTRQKDGVIYVPFETNSNETKGYEDLLKEDV